MIKTSSDRRVPKEPKSEEPRVARINQLSARLFFDGRKFKQGDYVTYTNDLLYRDVEKAAAEFGVTVEYCNPRTEGYNLHGPQTVIILSIDARG